jgi:hypothetical protein
MSGMTMKMVNNVYIWQAVRASIGGRDSPVDLYSNYISI